jgi:hypothetical protein
VSSIKVSALLGLYNVVNKSTVAIAYCGESDLLWNLDAAAKW